MLVNFVLFFEYLFICFQEYGIMYLNTCTLKGRCKKLRYAELLLRSMFYDTVDKNQKIMHPKGSLKGINYKEGFYYG